MPCIPLPTSPGFDPTAGDPTLSVVVPLFNEEENIASLWQRFQPALESTELDYEVLLVDDGSRDATPDLLDALHEQNEQAVVVRLSRNFGHQAAVSRRTGACPRAGPSSSWTATCKTLPS